MLLTENELNILREDLERRFGRPVRTSSDFAALSEDMRLSIKQSVSTSTLKRLWGYVRSKQERRLDTMNLLAIYLSFSSWEDYNRGRLALAVEESNLLVDQVLAQNLDPGNAVEFSWNPDRRCTALRLDDGTFRVTQAINSKLQVGEIFRTLGFFNGEPLYMTVITRDNREGITYVCGRTHGLTKVKVIKEKE